MRNPLIYPDKLLDNFDNIKADVQEFEKLFCLLPTEEMGEDGDIFLPVAILMSVYRFWIPEYLMAEKKLVGKCYDNSILHCWLAKPKEKNRKMNVPMDLIKEKARR
ncbi:hypothetical protein [Microcoleus vaginatus]|uniref:hypothetical protein n=1 Tax=Microcoleus vaginatus TaxID=119532 RepID=UPI0032A744AB